MEEAPVIVEQQLFVTPEKLWAALTDVDEMIQWYFDNIPDFKPEVGFYTEFNVSTGERDFLHQWRIVEAEPNKRIAYTWQFAGYEGDGITYFDLIPNETGTLLRLTMTGVHTFDSSVPEFQRESCEGGWKYFLQGRLKEYLDS